MNQSNDIEDLAQGLAGVLERLAHLVRQDRPLQEDLARVADICVRMAEAYWDEEPLDEEEPDEDDDELAHERTRDVRPASRAPARADSPPSGPPVDVRRAVEMLWNTDSSGEPIRTRPQDQPPPGPPKGKLVVSDDDLALIEQRCRLKAEAVECRRTRIDRLGPGSDEFDPLGRELIAKAREFDACLLWMLLPNWPVPNDQKLRELEECYLALAASAGLLSRLVTEDLTEEHFFKPVLELLAEAQSALRVAVAQVNKYADFDQSSAYHWLEGVTKSRRIYIARHMRLEDPADPSKASELAQRIADLADQCRDELRHQKQRRKLLNKLRYLANQIQDAPEDANSLWGTLARTVEDLFEVGMLPSSRDFREILLPLVDEAPSPEELDNKAFAQVLEEMDRYLASRPLFEEPEVETTSSAEVVEVRELLRGKCVVLIGGERRHAAEERLIAAFDLDDLIWISTREHESIEKFRAPIQRDDVVLVLLAIRWSSHSYGDAQKFCDDANKPLVRLPSGYNPNQVAMQILQQCGNRLQST